MSRIPDHLLPDEPVFISSPCEGCDEPVPFPGSGPDQYGKVIYDHLRDSRLPDIDRGNWHLECALEASFWASRCEPVWCRNCKQCTTWKLNVEIEFSNRWICVGCGLRLAESGVEACPHDGRCRRDAP